MTSAHPLTHEEIDHWKHLPPESCSFFQKYTWNRLLSDCYAYPDLTLTVSAEDSEQAFLPLKLVRSRLFGNRLISTPFSDYAGPTVSTLKNQKLLIAGAFSLFRQLHVDFLEIRLTQESSQRLLTELEHQSFRLLRQYCSFSIDLRDGEKRLRQKLAPSTRRGITRSENQSVHVREAKSGADLQSYHRLHLTSSREHGSPAHPLDFFEQLQGSLNPEGQMKLLLASVNGRDIAGLLLLCHESTMHYWQSALPNKYRSLNPFHLLLSTALTEATSGGLESFDLGRTRRGTGVYRFKRSWGGREYLLDHYCLFTGRPPKLADPEDLKYRTASTFWKKIPTTLLHKVEPRLIGEIAL